VPINVPSIAAAGLDVVAHQIIAVTQRSGGAYVNGFWVSASPTTLNGVAASVTPARGNDLLRLPEGRRNEEAIRILTRTALSSGDKSIGREADRVTWLGRVYEVEHLQSWDGAFYDAIAVRTAD
jgi:hypothetical protein